MGIGAPDGFAVGVSLRRSWLGYHLRKMLGKSRNGKPIITLIHPLQTGA
jgi:hypothetical protein